MIARRGSEVSEAEASLFGGGRCVVGGSGPRQQLVDALGGMGGEPGEDVAQVGFGVEPVELGGLDQGVHGGGPDAALVGAGEQPVFSSESDATDGALGGVVVDL